MDYLRPNSARDEREKRLAILLKADQETKIAERELKEWKRENSKFEHKDYSKSPISPICHRTFNYEKSDTENASIINQVAKSFDIKAEKPNTNQSLSSKYQKLKIKHKEQNEKFQCEKSKFLMEIERLETLIDEMQKNRPENLSEKLKATEQECERLRVEISMKCVEIQNLFEVQKSKDVEIGKTKVNCEELKKKMNDIKKQQLEDLKKHQESMKWIKHPPVKKEKILVKTNSRKGMKKELCVSCVEEQHWRKVALELTTKYFSALKTLKDDLNTFKISVQKACSDQVEDFIRSYKRKIKKYIINMEKKAEKS